MLEAVAAEGLASGVDAFCEAIAFTPVAIERIFAAARSRRLALKLHADQLEDSGGAELAARFEALSADHLEPASEAGVQAMAAAGMAAVLLPGACYTLRQAARPPVGLFRTLGIPMAVATDAKPGKLATALAAPGDEYGLLAIRPDPGRGASRYDGKCRESLRSRGPRRTRHGDAGRYCDLGREAAGRTRILAWRRPPLIGLVKDGRFVRSPPARP
jgi:imidazolonepropionase